MSESSVESLVGALQENIKLSEYLAASCAADCSASQEPLP